MNGKQPNPIIFFLDRTHGKATRSLLARVGIAVVLHDNYFPRDEKDPVWISRCGRENWVVLSGDKAIERIPENRQAVIDAKCKVLFFNDTNSRAEEWAAAVIVGIKRLYEIIHKNNGPLFVTIDKQARGHISRVRFAVGGGPKPPAPGIADKPAQPTQTTIEDPKPIRTPQQATLFKH